MCSLSILIVSWNVRDYLSACLDSIAAHPSGLREQIVVVDNASSDGAADLVRSRYPKVTIIANRENVGYCRANNQALAAADGDLLLLLNPDTEVRPGALAAMAQVMNSSPAVGIVGPAMPGPQGNTVPNGWRFPTVWRELVGVTGLQRLRPTAFRRAHFGRVDFDTQCDVDVVSGACLMMRRAVYEQVGGLDETLVMFFDEVDLCRRASGAGWRIVYLPQAEVFHHWARSTSQDVVRSMRRLARSRFLYFRRYHGVAAASLLWSAAWLGAAPHFARAYGVRVRNRVLRRGPAPPRA